jgi:hypothetical protein
VAQNARARLRLVIGPNPVFYKLDMATPLVPRAPGGPFATNANSVYMSIGGTQYRAPSAAGVDPVDLGCTLKLSDVLLVRNAAGTDVTSAIFEITTADVQRACDVFRPIFDATEGYDGRVSIEVTPGAARDTAATITEAKRLPSAPASG